MPKFYNSETGLRFFRPVNEEDRREILSLREAEPSLVIADQIERQLQELIKTRYPAIHFSEEQLTAAVEKHLGKDTMETYGVWVYYPWNHQLVHLLDEKEFVFLRTNRNQFKITEEEKQLLSGKRVGIIGLSVGQSVALTLAMERGFGELRIADFDTLDLSNLNRIRAGVSQLGLSKTAIVAREIAEIDPFLSVTRFDEGITRENIDHFIHQGGKLDLIIDECDSLDIKILCRLKARENGIPVIMDTSDRGMIDIERFDMEPERKILHGLTDGFEDVLSSAVADPQKRIALSLQIAGGNAISERLRLSLPKIGKEISTWPQLASSVALGGAVAAEAGRKILLGDPIPSGRFYVDTEQIIRN